MDLESLHWLKPQKLIDWSASSSPMQTYLNLDIFELRAITSIDKQSSFGDFDNIRSDENNLADEEPHEDMEDDSDDDDVLGELDSYPKRLQSEQILHVFIRHLQYRKGFLSHRWPFDLKIAPNNKSFQLTFIQNHQYADAYISFLLSANLNVIQNNSRENFTSYFEDLSYKFMKNLFTSDMGWMVKKMGAAAEENDYTYTGTLQQKMNSLCNDTSLSINSSHSYASSGDGKIDLVAFHPFLDNRGVIPIIFGQCACTNTKSEIERKASEVSYQTLCGYLHLQTQHISMLLSPVDMYDGLQSNLLLINPRQTVVIDRMRILAKLGLEDITSTISTAISTQIAEFKSVSHNYLLT